MLEIKGWVKTSFVDWDGYICSTIFTSKCNLRCPFCHNADLVLFPEKLKTIQNDEFLQFLKKKKDWIDGVCITGGEPCLHKDLPDFLLMLKKLDLKIKLDSNGTFPLVLKKLIEDNLVDYLAIDIKTSLKDNKYEIATGTNDKLLLSKLKKTIELVMESKKDYEFRTTVVPTLHTELEIMEISEEIKGAKKYVLQKFRPQNTIDERFLNIEIYSDEKMKNFLNIALKYVENCKIRG